MTTTADLGRDQFIGVSHRGTVPADLLPADQGTVAPQVSHVGGQPLGPDHTPIDDQCRGVRAEPSDPDQPPSAAHPFSVGVEPLVAGQPPHADHPCSAGDALANDHIGADAHAALVVGDPSPAAIGRSTPSDLTRLANHLLLVFADALDDLERTRIANENRVRALRDEKGMAGSREEASLVALIESIADLEHKAELQLGRALRSHPLGPWVKATVGIGEKQGGRMLAAIGDPYWNEAADRPRRGPAELWAYCGYHVLHSDQSAPESHAAGVGVDPSHTTDQIRSDAHLRSVGGVAPRRTRGQKANWNAAARMRVRLVAEKCIFFAHSPYRPVYDDARAKYAEAVHQNECMNRSRYSPDGCGTRANPEWGAIGSPLRPGHQHARALRLVAKAILRDLYLEAKRISEAEAS